MQTATSKERQDERRKEGNVSQCMVEGEGTLETGQGGQGESDYAGRSAYLEHGAQASNLLLRHASSNDLECLLLQLVHGSKATHALQNDIVQRSLTGSSIFTHPLMLQNGVGIRPPLGILFESDSADPSSDENHYQKRLAVPCYAQMQLYCASIMYGMVCTGKAHVVLCVVLLHDATCHPVEKLTLRYYCNIRLAQTRAAVKDQQSCKE